MKKILLFTMAALASAMSFAQSFVLTPDGFRDGRDTTKDYIVVQIPDVDNAILFQRAKNYFIKQCNSPGDALSESGTDVLSVSDFKMIRLRSDDGIPDLKFSYKFICEFRNSRCKITPIWIDLTNTPLRAAGNSIIGIYHKNGELFVPRAKMKTEEIICTLVSGLEAALKETASPASEDW